MILPRTNVFFSASNSDIPQCSSDSQRGQTCVFQCQGANIARALLSNVYCWPKKNLQYCARTMGKESIQANLPETKNGT